MLFFSVLLHPDSQYLLAFTFKGRHLTRTRLPQGFVDSPKVHIAVLGGDLQELIASGGKVLLQYADDLLIESPSKQTCHTDSVLLVKRLAECGHKGSLQKLHYCQPEVTYLGHVLTDGQRLFSPARVKFLTSMFHLL